MKIVVDNNGSRSTVHIPESLNELSTDQLLVYAQMVLGDVPIKLIAEATYKLLALDVGVFKQIPADQVHDLIFTHRIFEDIGKTLLTKQKLPQIGNLFGPSDQCDNLKGNEYTYLDIYLNQWYESKSDNILNLMIAVIYRPRKWYWPLVNLFPGLNDGDCRVKFNHNTYEKRAEAISKWRQPYKLAVLLFIIGNRQAIVERYDQIFKPDRSSKKGKGNETFHNILVSIAETGTFGTLKQVEDEYIHNLMMFLDKKAAETAEIMK